MKKQIKQDLEKRFPKIIVESALKKAERWMKNAYGQIDWDELTIETEALSFVEFYCIESIEKKDGKKTFNRGGKK